MRLPCNFKREVGWKPELQQVLLRNGKIMNAVKISTEVKAILGGIISRDLSRINDDMPWERLGFDPFFKAAEFISELEEAFKIKINENEAAMLRNVRDVVACVVGKLPKKPWWKFW